MGRIPIVSIMRGRKAHPRLGLRIRGCRHISLSAHYENIIPKESYHRGTLQGEKQEVDKRILDTQCY